MSRPRMVPSVALFKSSLLLFREISMKEEALKNCFSSRKLHYNIDNAIQQGLE